MLRVARVQKENQKQTAPRWRGASQSEASWACLFMRWWCGRGPVTDRPPRQTTAVYLVGDGGSNLPGWGGGTQRTCCYFEVTGSIPAFSKLGEVVQLWKENLKYKIPKKNMNTRDQENSFNSTRMSIGRGKLKANASRIDFNQSETVSDAFDWARKWTVITHEETSSSTTTSWIVFLGKRWGGRKYIKLSEERHRDEQRRRSAGEQPHVTRCLSE